MPQLGFLQFLTASGGNWVIYLLIVFSVIAVAVIIERIVIVTRACRYQEKTLMSLTDKLESGPEEVLKSLRHDSVLYRLSKELTEHAAAGFTSLDRHLETRLAVERRNLERRTVILGTLGNNAPFVGLLGTVLGVIKAFHDLGASAGQGPEVVMEGLAQALVATAVGILVALPCVAAFNYIKKRIKDLIIDADRFGHQLIGVLENDKSRKVEV
jgi:biopolymer transport protein ExbB/TolQ